MSTLSVDDKVKTVDQPDTSQYLWHVDVPPIQEKVLNNTCIIKFPSLQLVTTESIVVKKDCNEKATKAFVYNTDYEVTGPLFAVPLKVQLANNKLMTQSTTSVCS